MPKGQGWLFEHVCISGEDVKILVSCNGTSFTANYYGQAQGSTACYPDPQPAPGTYDLDYLAANPHYYDPYSFPKGSVSGTSDVGCTQDAARQWAIDNYPNRH
jgi:hypothetical protein